VVSRFHRVLHDEVWNHYVGAPLPLIQLHDKTLTQRTIGSREDGYVDIVPAGNYQAAFSTGDYSLVGCTVAPGFDFEDFSFIDDASITLLLDTYHPSMSRLFNVPMR